jgi:hypothetical protein
MKKLDEKSCKNLYGGWKFAIRLGEWVFLDHDGKRTGDKWHWWFE